MFFGEKNIVHDLLKFFPLVFPIRKNGKRYFNFPEKKYFSRFKTPSDTRGIFRAQDRHGKEKKKLWILSEEFAVQKKVFIPLKREGKMFFSSLEKMPKSILDWKSVATCRFGFAVFMWVQKKKEKRSVEKIWERSQSLSWHKLVKY